MKGVMLINFLKNKRKHLAVNLKTTTFAPALSRERHNLRL